MKKQIFIATLLKAGKFFCIFLLGSAVGVVSMWQYTLHFGMQHDDGTGSSRLITDKIAIVNLDEGITIHDEKVNYAEKLIINLDDNAQRNRAIGTENRIKSLQTSCSESFMQTMRITSGVRISRICS